MADLQVGKAVQAYRRRLGLGTAEAADRWKMSQRTLQEIETRGVRETYAGLIQDLIGEHD